MKKSFAFSSLARVLLLGFLLMIPISISSRHLTILDHHADNSYRGDKTVGRPEPGPRQDSTEAIRRLDMVQFAGSRLPDCSHACGSCMPCRLVIVGSACASLTEAESCPISYRCMCNNKTYPVP